MCTYPQYMYGSRGHGCTAIKSMHRSRTRSSAARLAQAQASFSTYTQYVSCSLCSRTSCRCGADADVNKRTGRSVNEGSARIVFVGAYSERGERWAVKFYICKSSVKGKNICQAKGRRGNAPNANPKATSGRFGGKEKRDDKEPLHTAMLS